MKPKRFNRQLNDNEKKAIANKAGSDKTEEDALKEAVCYAVECWAEYSKGRVQYNANHVSQGELIHLRPELEWMIGVFGVSTWKAS